MAKHRHRKNPWAGWNPVAPGMPPKKIQNLIAALIGKQVNQWSAPRQGAITGYTKSLAGALGGVGPQIGQAYGQAQQQQGTLDAALADRLGAQGSETANTLGQALSAAGQDQHPANAVRDAAQGASNASFALGSASQSQLIGQGAAASAYGAKLPGIAALGGQQASRGLQAQAQAMIPELTDKFMQNELQKWIARTGLGLNYSQLGQQNQQFYSGLAADQAAAGAKAKTAAQKAKAAKVAASDKAVNSAYQTAVSMATKLAKPGKAGLTGQPLPAVTVNKAYSQIYTYLYQQLSASHYGITKAKIKSLTLSALKAAGYDTTSIGKAAGGSL